MAESEDDGNELDHITTAIFEFSQIVDCGAYIPANAKKSEVAVLKEALQGVVVKQARFGSVRR